eukprot:TRINITY_DN19351_c0_g1_i2.p1 TRINITY_DN19351_c0_g1~~TRINITY_DN19351_c0_g1_i2.p1  ORF type:complete len:461 (-),score=82.41 TRINITY_DN19351_c0_g1_i2:91-1473(-)
MCIRDRYLPSDLAATYAERRPRKRMAAMMAWLGFQIFGFGVSLPAVSEVVIGYKGLTQTSMDMMLWVLPAIGGLGAPVALYALLRNDGQFRGATIATALLCTLASSLRLIPEAAGSLHDATWLMVAAQALDAAAGAVWGGVVCFLCYSRFEAHERGFAAAIVMSAAILGVAGCYSLLPSVVHNHSNLFTMMLVEAVLSVFGLVAILFGFPRAVAAYSRANCSPAEGVSSIRDAWGVSQTKRSFCALLGVALLLGWGACVTSPLLQEASNASVWGGQHARLLSCCRMFSTAAGCLILGVIPLLSPDMVLGTLGKLTWAATVHTVAACWCLLVLPSVFNHSQLIDIPTELSLVPAMVILGAAEGCMALIALQMLASAVPALAVGVVGCGAFLAANVGLVVGLGTIRSISAETSSLLLFVGSMCLCITCWIASWVEGDTDRSDSAACEAVSYTHLTLPTKRIV